MKRDLMFELGGWKIHPLRVPLILRGARQVGKSWLIRELGKTFPSFIEINFDKDERAPFLFSGDLDVKTIIEKIALYKHQQIIPGETLLFLDEIQECEDAIKSLRYFKEELPELHVVAAGSLLDFALNHLGIPVGRVQFLYLYPLSFAEFLTALGRDDLRQAILKQKIASPINELICDLLKTYILLGGMPEVLACWLNTKNYNFCQELQNRIVTGFRQDFNKYARKYQIEPLNTVFNSIPLQIGNKFKYINVDRDSATYPIKQALQLLQKAGVCYKCFHSSGQAIPLGATMDERKFKVYACDIGLTQRMLGINLQDWITQPLEIKYLGAMAEQLVVQEAVAYSNNTEPAELYYWHRESRGSNAEVDFLLHKDNVIVPVEVKSGIKGRMKSMQLFLATHKNSPYGLKIAKGKFMQHNNIHEIPLYGLESWFKA